MVPPEVLFTHAPVGIVLFEAVGTIARANPAFAAITGVSQSDLEGRNWWNLLASPNLERGLAAIEELVRGAQSAVRWETHCRTSGNTAPVRIDAALAGPSTIVAFVVPLTPGDSTERRPPHRQPNEIERLRSSLARQAEDLELAFANLEGEVRALGTTELDARAAELVARIEHFRQLLRLDRARFCPRPCDLTSLAAAVAGTTIRLGELPVVDADPALLTELFRLLIDGSPDVEIGSYLADGDPVVFLRTRAVFHESGSADREPGTQRMHERTRLAMAHKIVERHGGRLWIEDRDGTRTWSLFLESSKAAAK